MLAHRGAAQLGAGTDRVGDDPARQQYDLDKASKSLIKGWSYRYPSRNGGKRGKVPVKLETIRMLDAETREWLHDRAWAAMRQHLPEDALAGNS